MTRIPTGADIASWLSGAVSGMLLGAIIAGLSCQNPSENDVCEADCHARGFHEGEWAPGHERCTCFNTEFESGMAPKAESP